MKKELRKSTTGQNLGTYFEMFATCSCGCVSYCDPFETYPREGKYREYNQETMVGTKSQN